MLLNKTKQKEAKARVENCAASVDGGERPPPPTHTPLLYIHAGDPLQPISASDKPEQPEDKCAGALRCA